MRHPIKHTFLDKLRYLYQSPKEPVDNLPGRCVGLAVAPDTSDWQIAIQQEFANGLEWECAQNPRLAT